LALVACFLGGLAALVMVAAFFHQDALREALATNKEHALRKCASRMGAWFETEERQASREMARIRSEHGLEYGTLVLPDGTVFAHSGPAQTPSRGPDTDDGSGNPRTFAEPVLDETGRQVGTFKAAYLVEVPPWNGREAALWLGLVILVSLGFLLGLYRLLRRSLRPISKVRDRLLSYGEEMESRLSELLIQDESGAVVAAWNRLIIATEEIRSTLESIESQRELADVLHNHDASQAREALDWHPDGILLVDEFCQVSLVNKACRSLARLREGDPLGKPASNISRDAELNQVIERLASSSAKSHRATFYHTLQEDGLSTTLAITVANIQSENGPGGTLLVFRDASQQKQAEKARDDFLHQVTHEFRTPLSNIRAYTETLMEGILEDRDAQRECLNVINSEAARLGRLVEDVLTASQLEVGTARLRLSEVDLGRLLQQAVQDLHATADERNVDLHLRLPPKVPKIQGDKDRLAVVFNNLLGNAIKYTDSGGSVSLACEDRGRDLEITVTDTGIGIEEEELPRVFDKFFRSSSETVRERPGTGLGLATARQIVRLHGGEITVQSKPNEGSIFTVTLPVYEVRPVSGPRGLEPRGAAVGAE
jgi:two-component system phosphate regulon sensor histidine kinase PhoR